MTSVFSVLENTNLCRCALVGTVWADWTGNGLLKVLDAPAQVAVHCALCTVQLAQTIIFAIHCPCCIHVPNLPSATEIEIYHHV